MSEGSWWKGSARSDSSSRQSWQHAGWDQTGSPATQHNAAWGPWDQQVRNRRPPRGSGRQYNFPDQQKGGKGKSAAAANTTELLNGGNTAPNSDHEAEAAAELPRGKGQGAMGGTQSQMQSQQPQQQSGRYFQQGMSSQGQHQHAVQHDAPTGKGGVGQAGLIGNSPIVAPVFQFPGPYAQGPQMVPGGAPPAHVHVGTPVAQPAMVPGQAGTWNQQPSTTVYTTVAVDQFGNPLPFPMGNPMGSSPPQAPVMSGQQYPFPTTGPVGLQSYPKSVETSAEQAGGAQAQGPQQAVAGTGQPWAPAPFWTQHIFPVQSGPMLPWNPQGFVPFGAGGISAAPSESGSQGVLVPKEDRLDSISEVGHQSEGWKPPSEKTDTMKFKDNPNQRVQLPWHLYWDGKQMTDKSALTRFEYEDRVRTWVKEFGDKRVLGMKLLNGITNQDLYEDISRPGTDALLLEDGWETLISRVHQAFEARGAGNKVEKLLAYVNQPSRGKSTSHDKFKSDFQRMRTRVEASFGRKPGTMFDDETHGALLLAKSGLKSKDRRIVQLTAPDQSLDTKYVEKVLENVYYDDHVSKGRSHGGGAQGGRRSSGRRSSVFQAERSAPGASTSSHQAIQDDREESDGSSGTPSGSSEGSEGSDEAGSGGAERDGRKEAYNAQTAGASESESEKSRSSSGATSEEEAKVEKMEWPEFDAYVSVQNAKHRLRAIRKGRGFTDNPGTQGSRFPNKRSSNKDRDGGSRQKRDSRKRDSSRTRDGSRRGRSSSQQRGGSRPRSGSGGSRQRSGSRGNCAICDEPDHWKNECPNKHLDRGPPKPRGPSRGPPRRPKSRQSFFALGAAPEAGKVRLEQKPLDHSSGVGLRYSVNMMIDQALQLRDRERVDQDPLFEYGRAQGWGRWWRKAVEKKPEMAEAFVREYSTQTSVQANSAAASSSTSSSTGISRSVWMAAAEEDVGTNSPSRLYHSFVAQIEVGVGIVDSACNRTMMGEIHLKKMQDWLKKKGLQLYLKDACESFTFGNGSESVVSQIAVLPIGIDGYNGELEVCVVPKANTPLLLAKNDLAALGATLDFQKDRCRLGALSNEERVLETTPSGHYVLPLGDFAEGGHSSPEERDDGSVRHPRAQGPSLTIYAAEQSGSSSGLGGRMGYHSSEVTVLQDSPETAAEAIQEEDDKEDKSSEASDGPPELCHSEEDSRPNPCRRRDPQAESEESSDSSSDSESSVFCGLEDGPQVFTEKSGVVRSDPADVKREVFDDPVTPSFDEWIPADDLPESVRVMLDHVGAKVSFVRRHRALRATRFFPGSDIGGPEAFDRIAVNRLTVTEQGRLSWDKMTPEKPTGSWRDRKRRWTGFTVFFEPEPGDLNIWAWDETRTAEHREQHLRDSSGLRPGEDGPVRILSKKDRRLLSNEAKRGGQSWNTLLSSVGCRVLVDREKAAARAQSFMSQKRSTKRPHREVPESVQYNRMENLMRRLPVGDARREKSKKMFRTWVRSREHDPSKMLKILRAQPGTTGPRGSSGWELWEIGTKRGEVLDQSDSMRSQWSKIRNVSGFRSRLRFGEPKLFLARVPAVLGRSNRSHGKHLQRSQEKEHVANLCDEIPQICRTLVQEQLAKGRDIYLELPPHLPTHHFKLFQSLLAHPRVRGPRGSDDGTGRSHIYSIPLSKKSNDLKDEAVSLQQVPSYYDLYDGDWSHTDYRTASQDICLQCESSDGGDVSSCALCAEALAANSRTKGVTARGASSSTSSSVKKKFAATSRSDKFLKTRKDRRSDSQLGKEKSKQKQRGLLRVPRGGKAQKGLAQESENLMRTQKFVRVNIVVHYLGTYLWK